MKNQKKLLQVMKEVFIRFRHFKPVIFNYEGWIKD